MKNVHWLYLFCFLGLGLVFTNSSEETPPPPGAIGPYLNGAFPAEAPGSAWELEEVMPGTYFFDPTRILEWPGSDDLLVLCKPGELWRVSLEQQTRELVLDIKDITFAKGEPGAIGVALHPSFGDPASPEQQKVYLFYRTKPNPTVFSERGYNRLSAFSWDEVAGTFDPASEEVLIQQYDRWSWHGGGGMFFGKDGFLYLSLGDEGAGEFEEVSTQSLSRGFFSAVLRIDVDNDPSRSHPIRRQPLPNANPPSSWPATFSQGYSIPNDNPWQDPDGGLLEEFYALGARSPYSMTQDVETDRIWLVDVGSDKREELNIVERGDNLQWPYREGTRPSDVHEKPAALIGQDKGPFFEYDRSVGFCMIGGNVYRGSRYPELNGKYLLADWTADKVMALTNTTPNESTTMEVLIGSFNGQPVEDLENAAVTGVHPLSDGHVLFTIMGGDGHGLDPGKILRLKRRVDVPEPPSRLSELGAFTDLVNLEPVPGLIPYQVNAPLWSDRAEKQRWMALPNDGTYDEEWEQIGFKPTGSWQFPEGTVFVKQFNLPTTTNGPTVRLETRFFILGAEGRAYGLTYKWNEEGTEAFLLGGGTSREVTHYEDNTLVFEQQWSFPSREQCLSCHNQQAGLVLGVKTHQLNGDMTYPNTGRTQNQLDYLNQLVIFKEDIGQGKQYHRSYPLYDEEISLETRIRSYWDSNCAPCHRPGGVNGVELDLRFETPVKMKNIIQAPTLSINSSGDNTIVEPGDFEGSELWVRDASTSENQMPPLARSIVDEDYINALAEWIGKLTLEQTQVEGSIVFPNPSYGMLNVKVNPNWSDPFGLRVVNMKGQIVYEQQLENHNSQLFLYDLLPGTYYLILSAEGQEESKQIIIH
ncbi:MAG: PQQ-dependent sugar dehydrogenase [Bacteroidota bacterium]